MLEVRVTGMEEIGQALEEVLASSRAMRTELHTDVGRRIKQELDINIAGSIRDSHGRIRSYQVTYVGSGGGYVSVRPGKGDTDKTWRGKPLAKGALTNFLQSGHAIRTPSGNARRYRRRIRTAYVDGRGFYTATHARADAIAMEEADAFVDRLTEMLEK